MLSPVNSEQQTVPRERACSPQNSEFGAVRIVSFKGTGWPAPGAVGNGVGVSAGGKAQGPAASPEVTPRSTDLLPGGRCTGGCMLKSVPFLTP